MAELQRLTTEYVDTEDRLRLIGEVAPGATEALWLTQRLLVRLLPHLLDWLEGLTADRPRADLLQEFAQQTALAALVPQQPVPAPPLGHAWLVQGVDIASSDQGMRLTFKGEGERRASLTLPPQSLRQWLGILYQQTLLAEWALDAWPQWLSDAHTPASHPTPALH